MNVGLESLWISGRMLFLLVFWLGPGGAAELGLLGGVGRLARLATCEQRLRLVLAFHRSAFEASALESCVCEHAIGD